jgi:hypothetical protein
MAASISPYGKIQWFDANGDPLSAGTLTTYESLTNTLKDTYTTYTGAVKHSNPITLDAAGRAEIWLGDGAYTFLLKDSAGATIWSMDGITGQGGSGASFASVDTYAQLRALTNLTGSVYCGGRVTRGDGGDGMFYWDASSVVADDSGIYFLPGSSPAQGRWVRLLNGFVDPRWYGATGNAVTNDTAAFTAASVSANALSMSIQVEPGTYVWSTNPSVTAQIGFQQRAVIKWAGFRPTIKANIDINDKTRHFQCVAADAPFLNTVDAACPEWFGGIADGTTDNAVAIACAVASTQKVVFDVGVYITEATVTVRSGTILQGSSKYNSIIQLGSTVNDNLIENADTTCVGDTDFIIRDLRLNQDGVAKSSGHVVYIQRGYYGVIDNCVIENGYGQGILLAEPSVGIIVSNCHFNGNGVGSSPTGYQVKVEGQNSISCKIKSNIFFGGTPASGAINFDSVTKKNYSIANDTFAAGSLITVDSNGGNYIYEEGGALSLDSNLKLLNKAGSAYLNVGTRNTAGSDAVMDLNYIGLATITNMIGTGLSTISALTITGATNATTINSSTITATGPIGTSKRLLQSTDSNSITVANDVVLGFNGNSFTFSGAGTINRISTDGWTSGSIVYVKFSIPGNVTVKHLGAAESGVYSPISCINETDFATAGINVWNITLQLITNIGGDKMWQMLSYTR